MVDYIIDLAKRSQKASDDPTFVKGAYWDSEIKKAPIEGMDDYPVFTRKVHTRFVLYRLVLKNYLQHQNLFIRNLRRIMLKL